MNSGKQIATVIDDDNISEASGLTVNSNKQSNKRKNSSDIINNTTKKLKNDKMSSTPLSTLNRYASLSDSDDEYVAAQSATTSRKQQIPPIVVKNMTHQMIKESLSKAQITNFHLKYISIGIKIYINTLTDFNLAKEVLKSEKRDFFTHDVPSEATTKVVLTGLPDFEIPYVKEGLTHANITFMDVKKMTLNRRRYDDEAKYIVYFPNKEIKISDLKKTQYVHNVRVVWQKYIGARNGPTQCNNCQLYGHGAKNCNSPTRCLKCGGLHSALVCPRTVNETTDFVPKCCLCGKNHMANNRDCPSRQQYIQMRINTANRTTTKSLQNNAQQIQTTINNNNTSFPPLPQKNNNPYSSWQTHSPMQHQSNAVEPRNIQQQQNHIHHQYIQNASSSNENLFTGEELMAMTRDLILALRSCSNRMQQFEAIASVAIKFGIST